MSGILARFIRYIGTGGATACIDLAGFAILIACTLPVWVTAMTSFSLAAIGNYLLTARFVFDQKASVSGFGRFYAAALLGLLINVSFTLAAVHFRGFPPLAAKLLGIGVAFVANFAINALLVFRSR